MLRVTIDLVPQGDHSRTVCLGEVDVANVTEVDGTVIPQRDDGTADYLIRFRDDAGRTRRGLVRNFQRSEGFWRLLEVALRNAPTRVI